MVLVVHWYKDKGWFDISDLNNFVNSLSLNISFTNFIIICSIKHELDSKLKLPFKGFWLSVILPRFDTRKYKFSLSIRLLLPMLPKIGLFEVSNAVFLFDLFCLLALAEPGEKSILFNILLLFFWFQEILIKTSPS